MVGRAEKEGEGRLKSTIRLERVAPSVRAGVEESEPSSEALRWPWACSCFVGALQAGRSTRGQAWYWWAGRVSSERKLARSLYNPFASVKRIGQKGVST